MRAGVWVSGWVCGWVGGWVGGVDGVLDEATTRHCNIMITVYRISKRSCILNITSKRNHLRHITHKTTNNRNCSRNRDG